MEDQAELGIVAGNDQIINPDLERWYYARAKSRTIEIKGASHSVYESHPREVATVIAEAARNAQKLTDGQGRRLREAPTTAIVHLETDYS